MLQISEKTKKHPDSSVSSFQRRIDLPDVINVCMNVMKVKGDSWFSGLNFAIFHLCQKCQCHLPLAGLFTCTHCSAVQNRVRLKLMRTQSWERLRSTVLLKKLAFLRKLPDWHLSNFFLKMVKRTKCVSIGCTNRCSAWTNSKHRKILVTII